MCRTIIQKKVSHAFSLIEVLAVVAILAILVTVGVSLFGNLNASTTSQKTVTDVRNLNMAVKVYVASGGDLDGVSDPRVVLERLKTSVSLAQQKTIVGLKGAAADARLEAVVVDAEDAGRQWVAWDPTSKKFEIREGRPEPGERFVIQKFALGDATQAEIAHREETVSYASEGNWVWDYADSDSKRDLAAPPNFGGPGVDRTLPFSPPPVLPLTTPTFSLAAGEYPLDAFGKTKITLGNDNTPGLSELFVSNGSGMGIYEGAITLSPGLEIVTYAVSLDPDRYLDSEFGTRRYTAKMVKLDSFLGAEKVGFTYVDLGGEMLDRRRRGSGRKSSTVTEWGVDVGVNEDPEIPSRFHGSDYYTLSWTTDGSNPATSRTRSNAGTFSGAAPTREIPVEIGFWGSGDPTVRIRAKATAIERNFFFDSDEDELVLSAIPMPLDLPKVSQDRDEVELEFDPDAEVIPEGAFITYSTDGGRDWEVYDGKSFKMKGGDELLTKIGVPPAITQWFTPETGGYAAAAYEFLGEGHFDLDTSTSIASVGSGSTDGHVHEYNQKYEVEGADLFDLQDDKLDSIDDAIPPDRKFKIIVANGSLSPGARLFINTPYDRDLDNGGKDGYNGEADGSVILDLPVAAPAPVPSGDDDDDDDDDDDGDDDDDDGAVVVAPPATKPRPPSAKGDGRKVAEGVAVYDSRPLRDLPVFSINGVGGTTKLENLGLYFKEDAMGQAMFVPTNTGDVRKNQPGPNGEWRNGALTIQAIAVNGDGSPAYTTDQTMSNGGIQGVATSGLLWEATFFWHWKGPSLHDSSPYKPGNPASVKEYLESN